MSNESDQRIEDLENEIKRLRQALEIAESWGEAGIETMDSETLAYYEDLKRPSE